MKPSVFVLTLDDLVRLPPTPNARLSWQAAMRLKAEWRGRAETIAREWMRRGERMAGVRKFDPMTRCSVVVTITVPDRRRRDDDNLRSSLKPITDAIVRAGVIADDSPTVIERLDLRVVRGATKLFAIEYVVTNLEAPNA